MSRTKLLQELRKMRFEEAYEGWNAGPFRRYLARVEADGLDGLIDRRLE